MTLAIDHCRAPLGQSEPDFRRSASLARMRIAFAALLRFAAQIAENHRKRRAIKHLQALDDRMLKDIGISRCEILYRVHGRQHR